MREEFLKKHMAKMMFSVVGILALSIVGLIIYISNASLTNTVEASKLNALSIIDQFKTLRGYYVKSVIKKVKGNETGLKISFDHKTMDDAIPLPATMIHDMSELLSKKGEDNIKLKLYSDFPFPNRKDRKLDSFGQEALAFFKATQDKSFVKQDSMAGQEVVRVAVADKMIAQACVNCHNTRHDTPKNDWKLNDVRGVLEVISPIDTQLAANSSMLNSVIGITAFCLILVGLMVAGVWMFMRSMKKSETETAKIVSMMENTPQGAIFADKDWKIQYLNAESKKILKKLEKFLPVGVENIIGQSIDIFHKNPDHPRRIVSDPKNLPHNALFQVGPETVDVSIAAVYDQNQDYLGPMVSWEIATAKLEAETQMSRVAGMVENNPGYMMFADKDWKIQYVNPAAKDLLSKHSQNLSVSVDKIIGQSVEVFCDIPVSQQRDTANSNTLPYQTIMPFGSETFDMMVAGIFDKEGEFIGPLLSWQVVTEKIANEKKAQEMVERDQKQAKELQDKVDSMLGVVSAAAKGKSVV